MEDFCGWLSDKFTCEAADKEGREARNCFINFADTLRKSIGVIDPKSPPRWEPPPRLLGPSVWALRCQICGRASPGQEVWGFVLRPHNSDTQVHARLCQQRGRGRAAWAWRVSVLLCELGRATEGHHCAITHFAIVLFWQWCVCFFQKKSYFPSMFLFKHEDKLKSSLWCHICDDV